MIRFRCLRKQAQRKIVLTLCASITCCELVAVDCMQRFLLFAQTAGGIESTLPECGAAASVWYISVLMTESFWIKLLPSLVPSPPPPCRRRRHCFFCLARHSDKAALMAILGNNKLPSDVIDSLLAWKTS